MNHPARTRAPQFMILALIGWIAAGSASAQYVVTAKPGIVQHALGDVSLDGRAVKLSRSEFLQMQPGQGVHTGLGFVELLLSPDVYLRMGMFGSLRIERNRLDDTQLAMEKGSALVEIVQGIKGARTRVRLAQGEVEIDRKGLYRFDAGSGEIRVYGGSALVSAAGKKTVLKAGRMVTLGNGLAAKKFDGKDADLLHQWAARRSFELYKIVSNPRLQNHWQRLALGWAVNSNYRARFFSESLLREWRWSQHVSLDARIAAEQEQKRIREYLEQKAIREKRELEAAQNPYSRQPPY